MKQVIADTFETLGNVVQGTGKQVAADTKKAGEDVATELGLKQAPKTQQDDAQKTPAQTPEQYKKIEDSVKKRTAARYRQIQDEIRAIQAKKQQELPKYVTGSPGYDKDKAVKQLEVEEKPSFAKASTDAKAIADKSAGKEKLPPLPVQRASKKAEMFRGVSG